MSSFYFINPRLQQIFLILIFRLYIQQIIAINNPVEHIRRAVFHPNKPNSKTSATSFIIGAAIKNENVTPSGTPLCTNPRNNGIAEQEQNGVTTPSELANTFPVKSDFPPSIFLVLSGEKYDFELFQQQKQLI